MGRLLLSGYKKSRNIMSDTSQDASKISVTEILTFAFNFAVLALIIRGCTPVVKEITFPHLSVEKDIRQLLQKHQITDLRVSCETKVTSRVANCRFTEISQPLEQFIFGLNLRDFEAFKDLKSMDNLRSPAEQDEFWNYHHHGLSILENTEPYAEFNTCRSLEAFSYSKPVKVYGNLDRSPELRLEGGGAFEHFFLYHRPDINEACVHFTYAYG